MHCQLFLAQPASGQGKLRGRQHLKDREAIHQVCLISAGVLAAWRRYGKGRFASHIAPVTCSVARD